MIFCGFDTVIHECVDGAADTIDIDPIVMLPLNPDCIVDQIGVAILAAPINCLKLIRFYFVSICGVPFLCLYSLRFCSNSQRENHQTLGGGASRIDFPAQRPSQYGFLHG
jgi:hypothetical protein